MSIDPSVDRPRRTQRIGKYEVTAHIAVGGMGAVYRATDTESNRAVALKVLRPDLAAKQSAVERFRREARNASRLQHENIVRTYEFGAANEVWYLALEFVDGVDLAEYIRRKEKLDPEEAIDITRQAALALGHAFGKGIVHRDVKPSNFLLTRQDGQLLVKMADFGLAREITDEEARMTRDGTTVGTVDYMSPEQARDSGLADGRSDIYSLGCTLFHMLAGQPPFPDGGLGERILKHAQEPPPPLRHLNPRVSRSLAAVVEKMLAKRPEDRYQVPADLLHDLERIQAGEHLEPPDRDALAGLAYSGMSPRPTGSRGPRVSPSSKGPPSRSRESVPAPRQDPESPADPPPAVSFHPLWVLAAGLILLVVALVVLGVAWQSRRSSKLSPAESRASSRLPPAALPDAKPWFPPGRAGG